MMAVHDYNWRSGDPAHTNAYLLEPIEAIIRDSFPRPLRALDLGCGNGWLSGWLAQRGWQVVALDPSPSGLDTARANVPGVRFVLLEADPASIASLQEDCFDLVISTEVVEHLYSPRDWAAAAYAALRPGGLLLVSTPYHGYLKNLLLALTGRLDQHFTALWDGGHIKFWSPRTLSCLLIEAGFQIRCFKGCGRLPFLWKSMLIAAVKPLGKV